MQLIHAHHPDFPRYFSEIADNLDSPIYTVKNLAYIRLVKAQSTFEDKSIIALDGKGTPLALLLLTIEKCDGLSRLNCFGRSAIYHEFSQDSPILSMARKALLKHLRKILAANTGASLSFQDTMNGGQLTPATRLLLEHGIPAKVDYDASLSLTLSVDELHSNLRKSYKHCINKGIDNYRIRVLTGDSMADTDLAGFLALHTRCAGKQTRPTASWEAQKAIVNAGEGFVVHIADDDKDLGYSYFVTNGHTALYGVAAYDRDTFEQPISHCSLWSAILHAKAIDLKTMDIGQVYFPSNAQGISQKELDISFFKKGFGGTIRARMNLEGCI